MPSSDVGGNGEAAGEFGEIVQQWPLKYI